MTFGRTSLEGKRRRIVAPTGTPINDFMIRKVMPFFLLLDRDRFNILVVPNESPIFFCIHLAFRFEPICNALRFAATITRCEIVKNIVISAEMSVYPLAFVIVSL